MKPSEFSDLLIKHGFNFITGVPDSLFKEVICHIDEHEAFQHITSSNEGEACAIAAGYHLGTKKIAAIYLQNSGLGNGINPLTSLLDQFIYSIPALLLITWRGSPGKKDEPQHQRMGMILPDLLNLLDIPYTMASSDSMLMDKIIDNAKRHLEEYNCPYAILFDDSVIQSENSNSMVASAHTLSREDVLKKIVEYSSPKDIIISTTGKTSRELYEIRKSLKQSHEQDFLMVGSMGCAAALAFGVALGKPNNRIIVIDGDGACLMRLETMALIGHYKPANLIHIIIDNNAYESTGSQKTLSDTVNFVSMAKACQYNHAALISTLEELQSELTQSNQGPKLFSVTTNNFSRPNLSRPGSTPIENKHLFMDFLSRI